jgi:hypothetical protein
MDRLDTIIVLLGVLISLVGLALLLLAEILSRLRAVQSNITSNSMTGAPDENPEASPGPPKYQSPT